MFYEVEHWRSQGCYAIKEVDGSYLFHMHYFGDGCKRDIYKIQVVEHGKDLLEKGVEFDLEDIVRKIFAYEDLEITEIGIQAKATEALGFKNRECLFTLSDLIRGHSFVLSAHPSYMGGTPVILARMESMSDVRAVMKDNKLLESLGFDLEDYCLGVDIVKNIGSLEKLSSTKKMNLF